MKTTPELLAFLLMCLAVCAIIRALILAFRDEPSALRALTEPAQDGECDAEYLAHLRPLSLDEAEMGRHLN